MRAPRVLMSEPCTWYSSGHQPDPTPSEMRPAEIWSMVATCSATRIGLCTGSWKIPVPTRSVLVRAATVARNVKGSLRFPGMKWWWPMVAVSKPACSASCASANVSANGSLELSSRSTGSERENRIGVGRVARHEPDACCERFTPGWVRGSGPYSSWTSAQNFSHVGHASGSVGHFEKVR